MASRSLKAVLTTALAASFALAAVPGQAAAAPDPFVWTDLTPTYNATGKYAYEPFAASGGYERTDECVPNMGYHYVNPAYLNSLDPATPAALLYEDGKHGRELFAVEWVVEDKGQATPELFGRKFDEGQLPGHFTLHAWIYKHNPDGLLEGFNPKVKCPKA
ncbi:hypothetical protein GA0115233_1003154 [Streptomyces sp. DI166]|uniref:hypothetical protein n=1 Tax=Streptomyces sp. DI166 TaxID=1839783 RepID=UPI0007F4163D|nr:hypothetical protein [Streptomyces sp. DI166]SBT88632.1 hypothetical protein GA0115233_1003154 [Streptomyces sp. DI166]